MARVALSRAPATPGTEFSDYSEYDPLLGWRKRAGARLRFVRREYAVDIAINSHGLRDPERGYDEAPDTRRILALGDSFVEGYTVPLAQTVTQQLEAGLRGAGCPVEVVNGATTGYSTDQEYLFYRSEGVRYRPEVVVLFFYSNDVVYNDSQWYMGGVPKPIFVYRDGVPQLWKDPVPRPTPRPAREATEPEQEPSPARSVLLAWIRERLWFGAPRAYNALGRLGLWEPSRKIGRRPELAVYSRERNPDVEGAWDKTATVLRLLGEEVARHDARLLLVYIPSQMEVNDRAWQLSQIKYEMTDAVWDRGLVLLRLQEIADRLKLPVLDLTPPLREADAGVFGGPYVPHDGHWNAQGHEVAARMVQTDLRARGWLPGCGG